MLDDYTAPLGLDRDIAPRRHRRLWPVALALAAAIVVGVAGWVMLVREPLGGQPVVEIALPKPVAKPAPAAVAAPAAAAPTAEPPDDPSGQIVIRDP